MRRPTRPRTWQVLRAQEDVRVYAELQSKQRAAYGDDEAAREAAGKVALLRAKESRSKRHRYFTRYMATQVINIWVFGTSLPGGGRHSKNIRHPREGGQTPLAVCATL